MRKLFLFAYVVSSACAFATSPQPVTGVKRIHADYVLIGNGTSQRRVDLNPLSQDGAPDWRVVFDSMNTNPTTQETYSGFYGADPGPTAFAANFRQYMSLNDATFPLGQSRRVGRLVRTGFVWNPNGGASPSGTKTCAVRISFTQEYTYSDFGPAGPMPLSSITLVSANLAAGAYELDADLRATQVGLPIPNGSSGGLKIEYGSVNVNDQFIPLVSPNAAQPLLSPMISGPGPQWPGSNPSTSSEFMWGDDERPGALGQNLPNYIFEDTTLTASSNPIFDENYNYDYTQDNLGYLQPAVSIFTLEGDPSLIEGTVQFTDPGSSYNPQTMVLELRELPSNTTIGEYTVAVGQSGEFRIPSAAFPLSQYQVRFRSGALNGVYDRGTWLSKLSGVFTANAFGAASNVQIGPLVNGDVNGDNEIGPSDFAILANAFGTELNDPGFLYDADLDKNREVGPSDFAILATNFGLEGDS